jgi:hypothetical protein
MIPTEAEQEFLDEKSGVYFGEGYAKAEADMKADELLKKSNRIPVTGIDALQRCLDAGIPLKPFYEKSEDNDPNNYALDLLLKIGLLEAGARFKAFLRGWLVLDVDRHEGKLDGVKEFYRWAERERLTLPSYLRDIAGGSFPCFVRTPSGGLHLYFRHSGEIQRQKSLLATSVEIKTAQLTAAGSYKDGKPYTLYGYFENAPELPHFLLTRMSRPAPQYNSPASLPSRSGERVNLEKIAKWTEADCAGEGRNTFANRFSGKAARRGFTTDEIFSFLRGYHYTASLPAGELRAAVNSGFSYGKGRAA